MGKVVFLGWTEVEVEQKGQKWQGRRCRGQSLGTASAEVDLDT